MSFYFRLLAIATLLTLPALAEVNPDVLYARAQVSRALDAQTRIDLNALGSSGPSLEELREQLQDPLHLFYAASSALLERQKPRQIEKLRIRRAQRGRVLLKEYLKDLEGGPPSTPEVTLGPRGDTLRPWSSPGGAVHVLRTFPGSGNFPASQLGQLRRQVDEDIDQLKKIESVSKERLKRLSAQDVMLQRFVTDRARRLMLLEPTEMESLGRPYRSEKGNGSQGSKPG